MFTEATIGETGDASGVQAAWNRYLSGLRQHDAYLGATSGAAEGGTFVGIVRFTSAEGTRAEGIRMARETWLADAPFRVAPQHLACPTVEIRFGDIPRSAGFVQVEVFKGVRDVDEFRDVADGWEQLSDLRPDLLCVIVGYTDEETIIATNHFTSESEARAAEATVPPPEAVELVERWNAIVDRIDYIDLREPSLDAAPARATKQGGAR